MNQFTVYCHTNKITGKKYVGWTSSSIDQRWKLHIQEANKKIHKHRFIVKAIKKYGTSDEIWNHEILELCPCEQEAKIKEIYWISKLKTNGLKENNHGYNMTDGGDGRSGGSHTQKSKNKIRKKLLGTTNGKGNKGKKRSQKTKKLISNSLTGRVRPQHERDAVSKGMMGRVVSKETGSKISASLKKGNHVSAKARSVSQFTLDGKFINSYRSLAKAFVALVGEEKASSYVSPSGMAKPIAECCNGIRSHAFNFTWKWN